MTKFTHAMDAAHGWIGVPEALLEKLAIDHAISDYSYYERKPAGSVVWLEEDGDALLFIEAYRARFGDTPQIVGRDDGRHSPVRDLRPWRGTGMGWKAQFAMIEAFRAEVARKLANAEPAA